MILTLMEKTKTIPLSLLAGWFNMLGIHNLNGNSENIASHCFRNSGKLKM